MMRFNLNASCSKWPVDEKTAAGRCLKQGQLAVAACRLKEDVVTQAAWVASGSLG